MKLPTIAMPPIIPTLIFLFVFGKRKVVSCLWLVIFNNSLGCPLMENKPFLSEGNANVSLARFFQQYFHLSNVDVLPVVFWSKTLHLLAPVVTFWNHYPFVRMCILRDNDAAPISNVAWLMVDWSAIASAETGSPIDSKSFHQLNKKLFLLQVFFEEDYRWILVHFRIEMDCFLWVIVWIVKRQNHEYIFWSHKHIC